MVDEEAKKQFCKSPRKLVYAERIGSTMLDVALYARRNKALEAKDYKALKLECMAHVNKLKKESAAKRKAAAKHKLVQEDAREKEKLLENETELRRELAAELAIEQRGRVIAEGHLRTVRAQRAEDKIIQEEAMTELGQQLQGLTLKKQEAEKERDEILEIFCPGAKNLAPVHQRLDVGVEQQGALGVEQEGVLEGVGKHAVLGGVGEQGALREVLGGEGVVEAVDFL
ncbi:unnamed protein product [Ectocarpus sp. CCAP 1310/34]|nr:unnamed protein product [Ectocarpus sp. CCAP 1310/34]